MSLPTGPGNGTPVGTQKAGGEAGHSFSASLKVAGILHITVLTGFSVVLLWLEES